MSDLNKLKKIFADDPEVLKAIEKKELDLNLKTLDEKIGKDKFVEVKVNGQLLPVLKGDRGEKGDKGDSVQGPKGDKGDDGKDADEEKIIKKVSKLIPTKEEILSQIKIPIPASPDVNKIVEEVLSKVPKTEIDHEEILNNVVKELKEKKLLELRDIKGARLDRASGGFDMNDQRWHGAGLLNITDLIQAGINIFITGTGVPGDPYIINIDITLSTYNELDNLRNIGDLRPHAWYLIQDFQTIERVPVTGSVHFGQVEPLIVQATSKSTFAKQAFSPFFPEDIIEYDFIDTTTANGNVLLPNGNYGRISYRRQANANDNHSTYYDFRNIVFYHPAMSYTIPVSDFPITLVDINIGGGVIPLPGFVMNDMAELMAYFEDPVNGFNAMATDTGGPGIVFSLNGLDWGDFNYLDNALNPQVSTPNFSLTNNYYTFGNNINPVTGSYSPALDGNSAAPDIHIGPCSDNLVGQVLNNVIYAGKLQNSIIEPETINGVICFQSSVNRVGSFNSGFVIKTRCVDVTIGFQSSPGYYATVIGNGCTTIEIGNNNAYGVIVPDQAYNWRIGSAFAQRVGSILDFRNVLTLQDRVCENGYSNMDEDVGPISTIFGSFISLKPWIGIANLINVVNPIILVLGGAPFNFFDVTLKPKLTEIITDLQAYPAGTPITGVNTGATGQIVNVIQVGVNLVYQTITFSGDFTGETDITDGVTPEVVSSLTMALDYIFDPTTCQPSVGGNVVLDQSSGPITLKGIYGDYMVINSNSYDQVNVYQQDTHNFRP